MSDGMERLATGEYARVVESKEGSGMSDIPAQLSEPMTLMRTKDVKHLADRIEELEAKLAQQDDLVQAAVAAKLIEVHDAIAEYPRVAPDAVEAEHYDEQIEHSQSIIIALITPDAQAALDRVVAERFGVVRSEVVRLSAEGKIIDLETVERLLVAIRKGGE